MGKVRFEVSGALGILTLANPPLNLFSGELIEDLRASVSEASRARIRALLVRAECKVFSGGADVSIFKGRTAGEARARFTSHLRLIADLEELPFPTLAAVHGSVWRPGWSWRSPATSSGRRPPRASARWRHRSEPRRFSEEFNGSRSARGRPGHERSRTRRTNTMRPRSSAGTSSTESWRTRLSNRKRAPSQSGWRVARPAPTPRGSESCVPTWTVAFARQMPWWMRSRRRSSRATTCAWASPPSWSTEHVGSVTRSPSEDREKRVAVVNERQWTLRGTTDHRGETGACRNEIDGEPATREQPSPPGAESPGPNEPGGPPYVGSRRSDSRAPNR